MNDVLRSYKQRIATNLAHYRRRAKLTQSQFIAALNAKLGTSYQGSTVSAWEHETNSINSDYMPAIADILHVPLEDLYGQQTTHPSAAEQLAHRIMLDLTPQELSEVNMYISYLLFLRSHKSF